MFFVADEQLDGNKGFVNGFANEDQVGMRFGNDLLAGAAMTAGDKLFGRVFTKQNLGEQFCESTLADTRLSHEKISAGQSFSLKRFSKSLDVGFVVEEGRPGHSGLIAVRGVT